MKRFYCTICKRVKRVRKYPLDIQHPDAFDVTGRVGTCNRHTPGFTRSVQSHNTSRKGVSR